MSAGNTKNLINQAFKFDNSLPKQKLFLNYLATKLQIKNKDEWYNLSPNILKAHGGAELLKFYNGSVRKLLISVYPEYLIIPTILHHYVHIKVEKE